MNKIVLRMDDIGASTKIYNQYGKVYWNIFGKNVPVAFFANWFFLKRMWPFKQWGVYNELTAQQWETIFQILREHNAKLTAAITACWVDSQQELIPFDKKFPDQASVLLEGVQEGLIEIANHGLTHCVLKDNLFLPRLFFSNRKYHREFWDWLPESYHREHIEKSQEILTRIFKKDIVTFVPPGNVWTETTEQAARAAGIRYLSSIEEEAPTGQSRNGITYIGTKVVTDFHDREIALFGCKWLIKKIESIGDKICTIREYFQNKEKRDA